MAWPRATGQPRRRPAVGKLIDLTGRRFGRLIVLARDENMKKKPVWRCRCDCGNVTTVRGDSLRKGETQSCGCLQSDIVRKMHEVHRSSSSRLYSIYNGMKNRCYNQHTSNYKYYGGRGITICAEWLHSFQTFQQWALSHGYTDTLTIDRIDNDLGYSPDNCRWATAKEQRANQRAK